jgi:hypothetical protein
MSCKLNSLSILFSRKSYNEFARHYKTFVQQNFTAILINGPSSKYIKNLWLTLNLKIKSYTFSDKT